MNLLRKIFDDVLFAPTRYLKENGAGVDSSRLAKIVHLPQYRMTAIYGLGASITAFSAGASPQTALTIAGYAAWTIAGCYILNESLGEDHVREPAFFFDTKPDRPLPLPSPEIELYLERTKKTATKIIPCVMGMAATGIAGISAATYRTDLTDNPLAKTLVCIFAPVAAYMIAGTCGLWWRADQALKGNWNVLTAKPDPTPDEIAPIAALAPSL